MIKRVLSYAIPADQGGRTVEEFLRGLGYSHRLVVYLKQTPGGILAGGESVFSTYRLHPGQVLTVTLTEEEPSRNIPPADLPLAVVYEDPDILVVNKEAGIPVHPSQGHHGNTLANAASHYFALRGEPFVYRAVSRLDRDTSGLLVLAKHMLSACSLAGQMEDRRIRRRYLAFVRGLTPDSGTVTAPIGRVPGSVIQRRVDPEQGEPACTHYSRLLYNQKKDLSLISLSLETGRTHQIRVHMASIGHPLPGDFLYCPDYRLINRQPLHSWRLEFCHPVTGKPMEFIAPLPQDMAALLPEGEEETAAWLKAAQTRPEGAGEERAPEPGCGAPLTSSAAPLDSDS